MKQSEALKILAMVKGVWFKQPTDDLTARVWEEILKDIEPRHAEVALHQYIDLASSDPPTVAQLRHQAIEIRGQEATQKRLTEQWKAEREQYKGEGFAGGKAPGWYHPGHRLFNKS